MKGVIADRNARAELEKAENEFKEAYRQQVLTRMVEGYKISSSGNELSEDYNLDIEDDDIFLKSYREQRIKGNFHVYIIHSLYNDLLVFFFLQNSNPQLFRAKCKNLEFVVMLLVMHF